MSLNAKKLTPQERYELIGNHRRKSYGWEDLIREATYHQTKLTKFCFYGSGDASSIILFSSRQQ